MRRWQCCWGTKALKHYTAVLCRKLILFLSFLLLTHSFPPGCRHGRCQQQSFYSSGNEILVNPGGKNGEVRAATPPHVLHVPRRYTGPFRFAPTRLKGVQKEARVPPSPLQNAKGIKAPAHLVSQTELHNSMLSHIWTLRMLLLYLECICLFFILFSFHLAPPYMSLLPS